LGDHKTLPGVIETGHTFPFTSEIRNFIIGFMCLEHFVKSKGKSEDYNVSLANFFD